MCRMEKVYGRFGALLEKQTPPSRDFNEICRMLKVSEVSLNEVLLRELGMHGQEILDNCFGNGRGFY